MNEFGVRPSEAYEEEVPKYRMITTFNAQITKWGFWACGFVIGFLVCLIIK